MTITLRPAALLLCAMLAACGSVGRLKEVGRLPALAPAELTVSPIIEASIGRQGSTDRADSVEPGAPATPSASLFRTGAGAFFRDQRAGRVGDILTVRIKIADRADVGNSTTRTRTGSETAGVGALLGLTEVTKLLPGAVDPAKLVAADSASKSEGTGSISRSETINMTVAATVVGVMPNGNLAIRGRQEVRVNYELRELVIAGIVRPEDIARDNSIQHTQIADARISYGGRGRLSDVQQQRWGQQIYDALFPF